jgi:diketogulonate reductase-like aldo/keto reductase
MSTTVASWTVDPNIVDIKLNDGHSIPSIGLGVYRSEPGEETSLAVQTAIELGYSHIDTARFYANEADCLAGIKAAGVDRDEIFVTTKLRPVDFGFAKAKHAIAESAERLGGHIECLLLHCPSGNPAARYEAWRAMEEAVEAGTVSSIGISNFGVGHIDALLERAKIKPVLNQIELHPWLQSVDIVQRCKALDIVVEAYSPLAKAKKMKDKTLVAIATRLGVTPAQVLVRWSLQHDFVVLPKSVNEERLRANKDVYSFALTDDDMAALDKLEAGFATGWTPQIDDPI